MGGACGRRQDASGDASSAVNATGIINWAVIGRNAEERQAIESAVAKAQKDGKNRRASVQACCSELDSIRKAAGEDELYNYRNEPGNVKKTSRTGRRSSTTAFEEQYPVHGKTVASQGRQNVMNRRASSDTRRPLFWAGEMEAKKSTDVR